MGITDKHLNTISYMVQALAGTAIGYFVYRHYPDVGMWGLFSIILVLSPERKDSLYLALARIKANLIGATIGLVLFYFQPITLMSICVGVLAVITTCELLKIHDVSRTSIVALLIITLHSPGEHFWDIAFQRAGGVVLGCFAGICLTYLAHVVFINLRRVLKVKR